MPGTVGWSTTFGGTLTWNPQVQRGDPTFGVQNNQFGFTIAGNSNLVVVVEPTQILPIRLVAGVDQHTQYLCQHQRHILLH